MSRLLDEIRYDFQFIKSHTLQPKWYKIFKVFLLFGFLIGYALVSGLLKMAVFAVVFIGLAAVIHLTYRVKTHKFTQSWLDFVVIQENEHTRPKQIGKFYYLGVLVSAVIALIASQVLI